MSAFIPAPPEAWAAAATPKAPDAARVALGCPAWCTTPASEHDVSVGVREDGRHALVVDHCHDLGPAGFLGGSVWLLSDGAGGLQVEGDPVSLMVEVEPNRFTDPEQVRALAEQLLEAADALTAAQAVGR